jgi:hypothetical protein
MYRVRLYKAMIKHNMYDPSNLAYTNNKGITKNRSSNKVGNKYKILDLVGAMPERVLRASKKAICVAVVTLLIRDGRSSESKEKRIEQTETSLLAGHSLDNRETSQK